MIETVDARRGPTRVTNLDGVPEPREPRLPPAEAPREVRVIVTPDQTGVTVTILVRATHGRIRWEQRTGHIRLRGLSRADFGADSTFALGLVLQEVAGSLIP